MRIRAERAPRRELPAPAAAHRAERKRAEHRDAVPAVSAVVLTLRARPRGEELDESVVRHIVPQLKQAGARGIVEYPLNKIID